MYSLNEIEGEVCIFQLSAQPAQVSLLLSLMCIATLVKAQYFAVAGVREVGQPLLEVRPLLVGDLRIHLHLLHYPAGCE